MKLAAVRFILASTVLCAAAPAEARPLCKDLKQVIGLHFFDPVNGQRQEEDVYRGCSLLANATSCTLDQTDAANPYVPLLRHRRECRPNLRPLTEFQRKFGMKNALVQSRRVAAADERRAPREQLAVLQAALIEIADCAFLQGRECLSWRP